MYDQIFSQYESLQVTTKKMSLHFRNVISRIVTGDTDMLLLEWISTLTAHALFGMFSNILKVSGYLQGLVAMITVDEILATCIQFCKEDEMVTFA